MDDVNRRFLEASIGGNLEGMKRSLEQGANINCRGELKLTPLIIATCCDSLKVVKELLSHKANPDIQDVNGWTALHTASYWDRSLEIMRELLINRADPNLRDNYGRTFLDFIKNPETKRELEEFMESIQGMNIKG